MRKLIIYTIIIFSFSFCTTKKSKLDELQVFKPNGFQVDSISEVLFEETKKMYKLDIGNLKHLKSNGVIELIIGGDRSIIFKDTLLNSDDYKQKEFKYVGEILANDSYVVHGVFWENSEFYVINGKSGFIDTLWNKPLVSPNEENLVTKSLPYGIDGMPNGLQIWHIEDEKLSLLFEVDQQEWIPKELVWLGDSAILYSFIDVNDFWGNRDNAKLKYAKLSLIEE